MTVKIEQRKLLDLLEAYFKLAALESLYGLNDMVYLTDE